MRTDVNPPEGAPFLTRRHVFEKKATPKYQRTLQACSRAGHEFPSIRGFRNLRTFVHRSPWVNGACPSMRSWAAATSAMLQQGSG